MNNIIALSEGYLPLMVMLLISAALVAAFVILSFFIGPGRKGPIKGLPYESGIDPVGSAQTRFHSRFYLLAVLFLLFDVELVFFYPWAVLYHGNRSGFFLIEIIIFCVILMVAFVYAWIKGVFDWR